MGQGVGPRGTEHLFWGGDIEEGEGRLYTVDLVGGGVVCWQRGGTAFRCTCAPWCSEGGFCWESGGTLIWSVSSCARAQSCEAVGGILGEEAGSSYLPRWHFLLDKERVRLLKAEHCNSDLLSREEGRQRGGWGWGLRQGEN